MIPKDDFPVEFASLENFYLNTFLSLHRRQNFTSSHAIMVNCNSSSTFVTHVKTKIRKRFKLSLSATISRFFKTCGGNMACELVDAIADLKEEKALRIVKEKLASEDPLKILEFCRKGLEIVGKRFEEAVYFIPDLVMAGEILREITEIVKPKMEKTVQVKRLGKVLIGTVEGDIHDIGKNIVTLMLDINGFEVHDLGVDVPAQKFVEKIEEVKPEIVGLSGLLTLAIDSMKKTIETIDDAGLRNRVKIIIGGNIVDERVKEYVGADAYANDAIEAVSICKRLVGA